MSKKLQPVRGTRDILGEEALRHRHITNTISRIATGYNFEEIATPIFESIDVFKRSLGDTTDIVSKEMYVFEDRSENKLCLRPEGTAGVVRALISNGLFQNLPLKLLYTGPMFRYERPQKGRYRQFHQVGVEHLGATSTRDDIEMITLAADFLDTLDITATLEINSLGDTTSRTNYRTALVEYFTKYASELSEDSQVRLEKNPLRILDSKDENDRKLIKNAPKFSDYLTPASKEKFETVLNGLKNLNIPFVHNEKIVRGLDYYNDIVFEFTSNELGAQGTVLAGGRYDGLVTQMGGQPTPAVGWAAGIERLSLLLKETPKKPESIILATIGDTENAPLAKLARTLRKTTAYRVEVLAVKNVKKLFSKADKQAVSLLALIGEDEAAENTITLKHLPTRTEHRVPFAQAEDTIKSLLEGTK
ncbi:MAG: histidine--tRNA ligase [Alphaproteobacteria bacterium]